MANFLRPLWLLLLAGSVLTAFVVAAYVVWRQGKVSALSTNAQTDKVVVLDCVPGKSVLVLGDSRVRRWSPLPKVAPELRVVLSGVGGETTHQLLDRIPAALSCPPSLVLIQTGINDLVAASLLWSSGDRDRASANVVENIRQAALAAQARGAAVALMAILPPGSPTGFYRIQGVRKISELVDASNKQLSLLAKKEGWFYLSVPDSLTGDQCLLLAPEFQVDALHVNSAAYLVLNRHIEQLVAKL